MRRRQQTNQPRALNDPPAAAPGFAIDAAHDLDEEVEKRRLVEQLGALAFAAGILGLALAFALAHWAGRGSMLALIFAAVIVGSCFSASLGLIQ